MLNVSVGDLYTGSAITTGCERYLGDKSREPPKGVDMIRPLPMTLFGDGACLDPFGANSCVPLSGSLGVYKEEQRSKEVNNVLFGIVPNVSVRQGKRANELDMEMHALGRQKRTRGDKKKSKSLIKLIDYHFMLKKVFESLVACCRQGGFVVQHRNGKKILYRPFINLLIGDGCGNNEFLCRYNNPGTGTENAMHCSLASTLPFST